MEYLGDEKALKLERCGGCKNIVNALNAPELYTF